jgi:hypothetical protein
MKSFGFNILPGSNEAPAPNRRPRFPLGGVGGFEYRICAQPSAPAAVGEAQRSAAPSLPS